MTFGSSGGGFGAYGAYVWSAVGLFVVVTLVNAWAARVALRSALKRARRAQAAPPERGALAGDGSR